MNRFVPFLLLTALSAGAAAEGLNYTFLEAGYGRFDIDDADVDGDGFGVGGSFAIAERFHLFAGYSMAEFDDFDLELTEFDVGIGYNAPIADNIDVVATLAYVYAEVEVPGLGSSDDNGLGLGLGLRALVSPQVELHGGVNYVELSDSGNDTVLGAGFRFNFNEQFAAGLAGSWGDDVSTYTLTGRIYF